MFVLIAQVAEPVINGLDVVNKVDAFYHNAWLKLIITVVLLGTLIGVVIPLIIQRIQSSSFDKAEKRLKDEIEQLKNKTQENIKAETKTLSDRFDEIQKNLENQIDKRARSNRAELYGLMATSLRYEAANLLSSFLFYIVAARELALLKDYEHLTNALNDAISLSKGISQLKEKSKVERKESVYESQKVLLEQIDAICKILEAQGVKDRYSGQLAKIREICDNLTTFIGETE